MQGPTWSVGILCVSPTKAGGQFEVLFRIYGPEKAFFEKAWALPDIEKVS